MNLNNDNTMIIISPKLTHKSLPLPIFLTIFFSIQVNTSKLSYITLFFNGFNKKERYKTGIKQPIARKNMPLNIFYNKHLKPSRTQHAIPLAINYQILLYIN